MTIRDQKKASPKPASPGSVMGFRIEGPRLTRTGVMLLLRSVGLPVLALGLLADLAIQWILGWCVGLWCLL
jgi:hypothetical protein